MRCWPSFLLVLAGPLLTSSVDPVLLEIYYKTNCPHCNVFIHSQLVPLVEAQLPGSSLQVKLLPMLESGKPASKNECLADRACADVLAPICGLSDVFPLPAAGDDVELLRSLHFVACDLSHTAGGLPGHNTATVQACAAQAGLQWGGSAGMEECLSGDKCFQDLVTPEYYSDHILRAVKRLQAAGFPDHVAMPWVFLDGDMLACSGEGCFGYRRPSGEEPLAHPGTLLELVCSRLTHMPEVCQVHASSLVSKHSTTLQPAAECENCAEMVSFRWSEHPVVASASLYLVGAGVVAAITIASLLTRCRVGRVRTALSEGSLPFAVE